MILLQRLTKRITSYKTNSYDPHTGKTLGIRIHPSIAKRLHKQKQNHNIKSLRHTVIIAIKLGLDQLELTNGSPDPHPTSKHYFISPPTLADDVHIKETKPSNYPTEQIDDDDDLHTNDFEVAEEINFDDQDQPTSSIEQMDQEADQDDENLDNPHPRRSIEDSLSDVFKL